MNNSVADRCVYNPGDCIDHRYTVVKTLGEGSFGAVYMVKRDGQTFALKLLRLWEVPPSIRKDLENRFELEYKIGQIGCNNLVHSLKYGNVGGNPYIVMEFCPGGDLTPLLGSNDSRIPSICHHVLIGLQAMHAMGYVHRDLKPENVLFKTNDVVALTDFGIAGDRDHNMTGTNWLGRPLQPFGTYAYMSPEQANRARGGVTKDFTTDIWSFGVMTYELLMGKEQYPFGRLESHNELAEYQRRAKKGLWDKEKLSAVRNADQWIRVLEGCLVPDYKHRLQNATEVMRLLPCEQWIDEPHPQPTQPSRKSKSYRLRVLESEKEYDLNKLKECFGMTLTVGRDADNAITLLVDADSYVSRKHCVLEWVASANAWMIRDGQLDKVTQEWLGSTNGTTVNSISVNRSGRVLMPGDKVSIGEITLIFETT